MAKENNNKSIIKQGALNLKEDLTKKYNEIKQDAKGLKNQIGGNTKEDVVNKYQEVKGHAEKAVKDLKTEATKAKESIASHASPALAAMAHRLRIKLDEKHLVEHKGKAETNIPNKAKGEKGKGQMGL